MPLRLRKFIGAIALFALVTAWALVAMALAQVPAIRDNAIASTLYYVVAGIGWVVPARSVTLRRSTPTRPCRENRSTSRSPSRT
jgi:hypothetical protein